MILVLSLKIIIASQIWLNIHSQSVDNVVCLDVRREYRIRYAKNLVVVFVITLV